MENREIKFRAWEVLENKMYYQVRVGGVFDGEPTSPTTYIKDKGWVNLIGGEYTKVMQYTGIHDCNGKEIWEGDIDKYGYIVTYVGDKRENIGMNCGWYIQRDNFESWSQIECGDIDLEIIGNVYENPELLNNNINL